MDGEVTRPLKSEIPSEHCASNDTRLVWLWNQKMATAQSIYARTKDIESKMAASLILEAAMLGDLDAIELLLRRLEGAAVSDQEVLEGDSLPL